MQKAKSLLMLLVCLPLTRGADDLCFAVEGADVGGQGVEVMEAAVVAVCRHMGDVAHRVEIPGRQDGAPRIVVHIGYHGLAVALVEAYRVVVVVIEEWALLACHEGVVLLPLLL